MMDLETPASCLLPMVKDALELSFNIFGPEMSPPAPVIIRGMADALEAAIDDPPAAVSGLRTDYIKRFRVASIEFLRRLADDPAWEPLDRGKDEPPTGLDPDIWKDVLG